MSSGTYLAKPLKLVQDADHPCETLSADWAALLESGACSDITLNFPGGERRAHKIVLLARSEVFLRMFEQDMQETRNNRIDIPDTDASTIDDLLQFIYSGKILVKERCMYEVCRNILPLAKKYEVKGLVQFCSSQLVQHISENNAADILCLADMLGVLPLKQFASEFITQSNDTMRAVQDTEGFDKLDKSLLREILHRSLSQGGAKRSREDEREFPDSSNWGRLTVSQLRRACSERGLASDGSKDSLVGRLGIEEPC